MDKHEKYLFKIVARVIEWSGCEDVTKEEIAGLVMQELINIPLPDENNCNHDMPYHKYGAKCGECGEQRP